MSPATTDFSVIARNCRPTGRPVLAKELKIPSEDAMREGRLGKTPDGAKLDRISRRLDVDAIEALRNRCGQEAALKLARLGLRHARLARSRKRFEFWMAVLSQIEATGLDDGAGKISQQAWRLTTPNGNSTLCGERDLEETK
jgi:hypothetical protein